MFKASTVKRFLQILVHVDILQTIYNAKFRISSDIYEVDINSQRILTAQIKGVQYKCLDIDMVHTAASMSIVLPAGVVFII